ncbi:MAG: dockerin type I repeat-containing protein [Planctomycetota bacterium]
MRRRFLATFAIALGCAAAGLSPESAYAQWSDNFDAYATGTGVSGQGDWVGWDLSAVDADVVDDVAYSEPNSLRLRTDSDMVVVYSGFDKGFWKARAMVYIPSDHTGETYYILLNTYSHGGAKNWSTQVVFTNGRVNSLGGSDFSGGGSLPWITDEWVALELDIDLDANVQTIRYGGEFLDETVWQATGKAAIEAIDLYSNGGSYAYYDDVSFAPVEIGPRATRAVSIPGECPNPDPIQVTIQQPLAPGADPNETVTVTETVRGRLTRAQVTAKDGGSVADLQPRSMTSQGFVSSWLLLGPFTGHAGADNPGCDEMRRDFLTDGSDSEVDVMPEDGQTIETEFGGAAASTGIVGPLYLNPGGVPTWNAFYDTNDTVDFTAEYYGADYNNVMMYALAYVWAENSVDVDLCVGSDDSIQVLIDGSEAHCLSIPRGVGASNECQDTVPYGTLSAGEHTVLVKVFEGGGAHAFRLGFKAAGTADPAPGITACLKPGQKPCVPSRAGATITWTVKRAQLASGIGYTVDFDSGSLSFDGDVAGLRILGPRSTIVCPPATDGEGYLTGSQFVALGPFGHTYGCGDGGEDLLLGNHIAPTLIRDTYPSVGDTVDYDPSIAVTTGYVGPTSPDGKPVWRIFDDRSEDGTQNLGLGLGDLDRVMGWLVTYVEYRGAEPGDFAVCLGSDDGAQLWWDCDALVTTRRCQRLTACNVGTIPITVTPGIHRIAVGVWENEGAWSMSMRLLQADGVTPIVDGDPAWRFLGRDRPAGYAPEKCPGCPPVPVTITSCAFARCTGEDGVRVRWTNPPVIDLQVGTRIEVNGVLVATVAPKSTTYCIPKSKLPEGVYEIAVIQCGGVPAVCSPFKTNALGQIRTSSWLSVGPFENPNDGCNGTGNLNANHTAPTEIRCFVPAVGDEMPFDLTAPGQASTNYSGPVGPNGKPLVEVFADGMDDGDLDLAGRYGAVKDSMAWLFTYVRYKGEPGDVTVCVGSGDSAQVWFNDTAVITDPACRERGDCDASATVAVRPGVYRIALGVWNDEGPWGARLSLRDAATGDPIVDGDPRWEFLGTARPAPEEFVGGAYPCQGPEKPRFVRGDTNADGTINITDGIFLLNYLFLGGSEPPCEDATDANDDSGVNITDAIYVLSSLFLGGPEPPPPYGEIPAACGFDPTEDELDCAGFAPCS